LVAHIELGQRQTEEERLVVHLSSVWRKATDTDCSALWCASA